MPGPDEKPLFTVEPLSIEDLSLLAELFYLPYEHGPKAMQMLKEFNWLRANSSVVSVNCKRKESEKVGVISPRVQCSSLNGRTKWWGCSFPSCPSGGVAVNVAHHKALSRHVKLLWIKSLSKRSPPPGGRVAGEGGQV